MLIIRIIGENLSSNKWSSDLEKIIGSEVDKFLLMIDDIKFSFLTKKPGDQKFSPRTASLSEVYGIKSANGTTFIRILVHDTDDNVEFAERIANLIEKGLKKKTTVAEWKNPF